MQGVAPIWIPHFRRPFSPSVRFNFPVLHFRENGGWGPPDSPSVVLRWNFLKHCFLKNSYKRLLRHFLYMFLFTYPQAPFRQLGPSFLGWKSIYIWQIIHISLYLFYAEGSSKTSCWYSLQRKFNWFVFCINCLYYLVYRNRNLYIINEFDTCKRVIL